ncbi:hypothetical protein LUZ60_016226 [Juncus effusus]|nr:hypothetical protein LUZ60_016226 [Juncus effusus]
MSDNEKETKTETEGGATSAQNADWEVVSLTASAYAASPPQPDKSGHFVFPPSEHENLPIQTPQEVLEQEEETQQEDDQENQETETETPRQEEQEEEEEEELIQNEEREVKSENEKSEEREEGKREKEGIEWVKKRVSCFYKHVKEANAYWSVFVAATLVGLVILGHRWQREKTQSSYQIKSGTNTSRG